ncbi:hypothetical protein J6590_046850 [Homalodisca vitripennis]|nr:hypothetical protein J6590_046850 [Homalodisca vitripennis]
MYGLRFFNKASTNEKPQHNSWCTYKQAEGDELPYNNDKSMDEAVIEILSDIDIVRVRKAVRSIREDVKKRRQHSRTLKKRKKDVEKQE